MLRYSLKHLNLHLGVVELGDWLVCGFTHGFRINIRDGTCTLLGTERILRWVAHMSNVAWEGMRRIDLRLESAINTSNCSTIFFIYATFSSKFAWWISAPRLVPRRISKLR
jgi:hypothetical protein